MAIEIGTGHDNAAYNNRVISAGLLPNGTKIPAQNVGLSLYDVYGNIANGSMYNNNMYNNTVGWMCWAAAAPGTDTGTTSGFHSMQLLWHQPVHLDQPDYAGNGEPRSTRRG